MIVLKNVYFVVFFILFAVSCVSKKEYLSMQLQYDEAKRALGRCGENLHAHTNKLALCEKQVALLESELSNRESTQEIKEEQIDDLRAQLEDARKQRDRQVEQVGDLTVLNQSSNENIKNTLNQLEKKDKYITYLQNAKSKADSINLALAVNLKGVLDEGLADSDVNVEVDKTVVFINLSDKMLFESGKTAIRPRAREVLGKIAKIIESRPELEVMVEGYTDNVSINTNCMADNWDLSVHRATAVVRVLQKTYKINPDRLIAAGRGEHNTLTTNDTPQGRSINRRTRIILLPKLNQFYDLLDPKLAPN